jgi:hypothetical protein
LLFFFYICVHFWFWMPMPSTTLVGLYHRSRRYVAFCCGEHTTGILRSVFALYATYLPLPNKFLMA